ncbi:hypothetical protein [Xanthocytophaga flava]|uniref:hypothetical protein n=1 Tax=Xanthocytophaga flava TaxID=3048013 RepID=UPI0028D3375E|nr:hypothetical protein [Xanthocytophaga flavus]MDJ1472847.1 hypothetical protein [Xanthocytophaga flavus]
MNIADIKAEFGAYYLASGQNFKNLLTLLYHKSEMENEFTTKVTDSDIWRDSKVSIGRLLQPFQKGWTPTQVAKFEPSEIRQFPVKVDYEDYPDDLRSSWLGFLVDNKLNRAEWPIVRWLVENLIIPKMQEDYELYEVFKGVYVAPTPGVAGPAGTAINGVEYWIQKAITKGVAPITMGSIDGLTDKETVDYVEDFCRQIDSLYRNAALTSLACNQDIALRYSYGYGEKYGQRMDFTGDSMKVKGTNIQLKGFKSMQGSDRLWITPKGNAVRLQKENVSSSNFQLESLKRQIFLYNDSHKGLGFSILDLLFFSDQA